MSWLAAPETQRLKAAVDWQLANIADDHLLRERLRSLVTEGRFLALWWYWAPKLHARNRALFRAFIRRHYTQHFIQPGGRWRRWHTERIAWRGEVAASLEPWLTELAALGEVELFKLLYLWKHRPGAGWRLDSRRWCSDVVEGFEGGRTRPARAQVLALHDVDAELDEHSALRLYQIDAGLARPFILKHLPARGRWWLLAEAAHKDCDPDFLQQLHRAQIPFAQWQQEALSLCERIPSPAQLQEELEAHHPASAWKGDFGATCLQLLQVRGADVLPYVLRHLSGIRREGSRGELLRMARRRGWMELWAGLLMLCGTDREYNAGLQEVLEDWRLEEPERQRRLALLSGVSREWQAAGLSPPRLRRLTSASAQALYASHPQLLRQLFMGQLQPQARDTHLELFTRAWATGDAEIADTLASRYILDRTMRRARPGVTDCVAEMYVALKRDAGSFARRSARVLTRIPAGSIPDYAGLIRVNRLARLLFEGSLRSFLEAPEALSDLLEGQESQVQHLAYRVLALQEAQSLAVAHLELLLGALLRPLPRRVRLTAFAALENAAVRMEEARVILARAREACSLPDRAYPREQLVGLMGRLLARHPALAQAGEQPVIYRRTPGA